MQQEPIGGRPPIQYVQAPVPQPPQKSGGFSGGGMGGFVVALLVALAVSYGMLQFMGVPKSELTAFQNTIQSTVNTFSGRISAVEGRSVPPDLSVRMADVEAKVRAVTTVDTSGLVTKTAYDAKVKELEDAIATLKTATGTGTTTGSTTGGTVTVVTNPTNVQTLGSTQICYTLKVSNTTSQWCYVRPIININLHTGQSPLSSALSGATITISIGGSAGNFVDSDFQVTGTASSAILIPTLMNGAGSGEMQIGAGVVSDVLVCITITHPDARIWDIASSVNWRSL